MNRRISVLCLSIGTIVAYGYALGGLGGYMFGRGRPLLVAAGLIGGTLCAWLALHIWRVYLDEIAAEDAEIERLDCKKENKNDDGNY